MTKSESAIDTSKVKAANNAYYSALSKRETKRIEAIREGGFRGARSRAPAVRGVARNKSAPSALSGLLAQLNLLSHGCAPVIEPWALPKDAAALRFRWPWL
jgi:hypothetical protein